MARIRPTHTQFPDDFLDFWMAELTDAEWRCLCYIVRHTIGYKKDMDGISYKQFLHGIHKADGSCVDKGTGIKSTSTLTAGLAGLERRGLVARTRNNSPEHGKESTDYRLIMDDDEADDLPLAASATLLRPANDPTAVDEVGLLRQAKMATAVDEVALLRPAKIQKTTYQQTTRQKTSNNKGADKPRAAKPPLKETHPDLAADRDACIDHWATVTGKRRNAGTCATVAGLLTEHTRSDLTGTIDALWRDPFWRRGNMSWSVIADRIAAFKGGTLTASAAAAPQFSSGMGRTHERPAPPAFVCPRCCKVLGAPHKDTCDWWGRTVDGTERL